MIFLIVSLALLVQGTYCASSEVKHRVEDEELIPLGISELKEGWLIREREKTFPDEKMQNNVFDQLKKYEQNPKTYEFNINDYLLSGQQLKTILKKPKITKKDADDSKIVFDSNNHKRGEVILFCTDGGNCYHGVILIKIFWGPDRGKWLVQDQERVQTIPSSHIGKNPTDNSLIYRNPLLKDFAQYKVDWRLAENDKERLEVTTQMLWQFFLQKDQLALVDWIKPISEKFHELFGKLYPSVIEWTEDLSKNGNRHALIEWYDQKEDLSASEKVKKVLFMLEDLNIEKIKQEFEQYVQAKKKLNVQIEAQKEEKKGTEKINALILQLEQELNQLKASKSVDFGQAISKIRHMLDKVTQ